MQIVNTFFDKLITSRLLSNRFSIVFFSSRHLNTGALKLYNFINVLTNYLMGSGQLDIFYTYIVDIVLKKRAMQ